MLTAGVVARVPLSEVDVVKKVVVVIVGIGEFVIPLHIIPEDGDSHSPVA